MTPARFSECLDILGWQQRPLSRRLGRPESTIRQWVRGTSRVPDDVAAWLDCLADFHSQHPAPHRTQEA